MTKFAALIPIKDHSERVPGKNFRAIGGKPLWQQIVETLSSMSEVDTIFIDTDSQRFTAEVLKPFPKVRIIVRPEELRGDFVSTNKLFAHDLQQIDAKYDRFLQTHTTNPLLRADTIRAAMKVWEKQTARDSLFTVTAYQGRFYRPGGSAINHDPRELIRTQDLEPVLEENSNLYLFTRKSFAATGARVGKTPMMFEMDRLEATDIDDDASWNLAALLLKQRSSAELSS